MKGEEIIQKGFIAITDGKISHIGKATKALSVQAKRTLNGQGKVALPGLVNCHTHVAMTLFRGIAEDRPFDEWWEKTIWPLEQKLERSHIYNGALLGCLEMIKSGTTCFSDMYFHEDAIAEAVQKSGLRAVLASGIIEAGNRDQGRRMLDEAVTIAQRFQGSANGRINIRLGPHTVYTCSPELLKEVRKAASKLKIGLHIHLAESMSMKEAVKANFGLTETELLEEIDFLDSDVLVAHCIHLSKEDRQTLKKHDVKVAYNPVANMKLASGVPKIWDLSKQGVTVGIGTDGAACNNSFDMFESMKFAALLQKTLFRDPAVLPAEKVLRMATIEGAKALGIESTVGSLEVDKKADLILVDFEKPHLTPTHDFYANLVYSAHGSDVDTVIVDGEILMENRKVKSLDEPQVMKRAQENAYGLIKE
ncbi:MAG: amidohydrolase [Candidatus Bathyarchaeota archaeon]|nr:MAG: amidohydrolase [Candidatus Bathyarchaeota archaeon]